MTIRELSRMNLITATLTEDVAGGGFEWVLTLSKPNGSKTSVIFSSEERARRFAERNGIEVG